MSNSVNQSARQGINYFPHSAGNQSKDNIAAKTTDERLENPFASLSDRTLDALLSVLKGLIDTVEDYIAPEDEPNQHDCLCGTSDDDVLNGHGSDNNLYGGSGGALKGGDDENHLFGDSGDDFFDRTKRG
ncbi:MAG: hypothetical protein KAG19_00765 [Methylococcales bacterium]|nr:hypothetical protein [Methylococcales bacterium]